MNWIKILGITASVVGTAASILGNWVSDKKAEQFMEETIDRKLSEREDQKEEES